MKVLLGFLILLLGFGIVDGGDASRLVAFKQISVNSDPNGVLSQWTLSPSPLSPCSWRGVVCSGNGQVTELNLTGAGLVGNLNISDLQAIQGLARLDFSGNSFSGNFFSAFSLSDCGNLHMLNFSGNKLTGSLPRSLSSCKSLSSLDVSHNLLSGEIPATLLSPAPPALAFLDLSSNNFTGNFLGLDFGSCFNLTVLNVAHNALFGAGFPLSLASCQLLERLDVSYNQLRMNIPGPLLSSLTKLRSLSLAHNQFFGRIPLELGNACATLEELDLSWNQLIEGLPPSFSSCSSLSTLNLGHNSLSGDFVSTVISSLSSLTFLAVPFNNITVDSPLSLLANCTRLQVLDLSSNALTGTMPPDLCTAHLPFPSLEKILLPNNYLSGTLPPSIGNCSSLRTIDLSFNNLNDVIPSGIWSLPNIQDIVMWANDLTGEIPEGICVTGGNLQTLILNNNFLRGQIPRSISYCTDLIWISLSSNKLTGEIPEGIGNLVNLAILQLGNNSLQGNIPLGLGSCKSLIWLDLNSNSLTGSIPENLSDQAGLVFPGLVSGKQFAFVRNEGGTECRGAGGLVEFEGIRVERLQNFPMVHSCPSTRIYTGVTVYTFASNGSMIYLDLSYNSLSGDIPRILGAMKFLQVLNLGHNELEGNIPSSFGGLKAVGVLDLSHNKLQGFIPGSLGGLSFLSDLDVSNNNLSGQIPSGGQLTTFSPSRYANNSGLCGVPLPLCGSGNGGRSDGIKGYGRKFSAGGVIIGITLSLLSIIVLGFSLYRIIRKYYHGQAESRENKYIESLPTSGSSSWKNSAVPEPLSINVATFEKPLRKLTFAHLLEATNGFSAETLIGSGGFGDVYKAQLKDGCTVAIKKLIHATSQGDREFMAEMETIGKIKHRNLVPLLGYCKIGEERLLVYEYMRYGSLEDVLHNGDKQGSSVPKLNWVSRKKIAIGSARGLAFLHHSCIPHIIHRDMKSSNVLIDGNLEARVSDFGMARLVSALDTHLSVSTLAGTPGYVPPEYYQSFRCTAKGDVYSYGVILLELLSGKKPIDRSVFGDDNNLIGWAKQLQREKRESGILDPDLVLNGKASEEELLHYLKIAFLCVDDKSWKRPTMIQVMAMFKQTQGDSSRDFLDDLSMTSLVIEESSHEKEPSI